MWPLVPLLALTIGLKISPFRNDAGPDQASVAMERRHIVSWLNDQGFRIEPAVDSGLAAATGLRGQCRLTIFAVDARGFQRELVKTMRPAGAALFFVHQGRQYSEQPVWLTSLHHHIWARARDFGVRLPRSLVFGVTGQACRSSSLRWDGLGNLP